MKFPDGNGIKGVWNDCNIVHAETLDSKVIISSQNQPTLDDFQALIKSKLKIYLPILQSKSLLKTQEKIYDTRFTDNTKKEPMRQMKPLNKGNYS